VSSGKLDCQSTSGSSAAQLAQKYDESDSRDDSGIIALFALALVLQTKVIICLLAGAGVLFLFGILFLVLLKRNLRSAFNVSANIRRKRMRTGLYSTVWLSVGLAVASATSIDQTTSALQYTTNTVIDSGSRIKTGTTLRVLQWLIVVFSTVLALGLSTMFKTQGGDIHSGGIEMGNAKFAHSSTPPPPPPPPPLMY
jgi:hypothetical protein